MIQTMASKAQFITCGLLNVQSIRNKTMDIREEITSKNLDIMVVTETWLKAGVSDNTRIIEMTPETHTFHHKIRGVEGGRVA